MDWNAHALPNDSFNTDQFESYKLADVYSVGLVFWEMAKRCEIPGKAVSDYCLPYFEIVGDDPEIEEMRKVVCIEGARPTLPNYWASHELLGKLSRLMSECWYEKPSARLTALRMKKTLAMTLSKMATAKAKAAIKA